MTQFKVKVKVTRGVNRQSRTGLILSDEIDMLLTTSSQSDIQEFHLYTVSHYLCLYRREKLWSMLELRLCFVSTGIMSVYLVSIGQMITALFL